MKPKFDESEREHDTQLRIGYLTQLRNFFVPSLEHLDVYQTLAAEIMAGYETRNPLTPEGQAMLYGTAAPGHSAQSSARISVVTGLSGMGKSALVSRILAAIGELTIRHTSFQGIPFPETQLLYLRRNIPHRCTPKDLCASFGSAADLALAIPKYASMFARGNANTRQLLQALRTIIVNHHVGCLILDEFQNLRLVGIGADAVISMLINLCDEFQIPIFIVGTYATFDLAQRSPDLARRIGHRFYDMARPKSADSQSWQDLCATVWKNQWVKDPKPFDSKYSDALYQCSQGVTGIMLSIFEAAQIIAMRDKGDDRESVTEKTIAQAYEQRGKAVRPLIEILKANDPRLVSNYEALYAMNLNPTASQDVTPRRVSIPKLGGIDVAQLDPTVPKRRARSGADKAAAAPDSIGGRVVDDVATPTEVLDALG
ncbi:ATP-binding protein [Polaromonas sp. OV174]|uniref:ATP-binding protein n=1 Tax=Polaromonas sp. OV174 TaxID=1855300 RepID=UPI001C42F987|nr:ATP-binding protein [Polaromonas sp. OV174]